MSDRTHEPEQLLESLLSREEAQAAAPSAATTEAPAAEDESVDELIDELETLLGQAKRVPFGRRLMVDEAHALELVDRLRAAVPTEVRQAQRIIDEQDRIVDEARDEARRMLHERGLIAELDVERERMIAQAERESERIRSDADAYVRGVLGDLAERLNKIQASVHKGLDALGPTQDG